MTVREYIGARYVPVYIGEWDNTVSYEPLSIVSHQGNSYTSRQYVPIGTPITDETFWALTGNYNAQVEQYRQEVVSFDNRISTNTSNISGLQTDLNELETDVGNDIATLQSNLNTTNGNVTDNAQAIAKKIVMADDYGAIGNGQYDSTSAIQQAIDENPNATIAFKGGLYIIKNTIFLNGDSNSTLLNLSGATIKWDGASSTWVEGNTATVFSNHDGIHNNPIVMFGVERRVDTNDSDFLSPGRPGIINGTIDCNYKADIGIQNVGFVPMFVGLRVMNFQYAGILNGTIDGVVYANGNPTTDSPTSTQTVISDCYFTRNEDMSYRWSQAIMVTFPDNQIDNVVTNRSMFGMTFRCGGNSVSNTHITIQYPTFPTDGNYEGANIRLWPFTAGLTQINVFENMYFNAGRYAFYTYNSPTENYTNALMRTMVSNSHYTLYKSNQFVNQYECYWFGGEWGGIIITNECGFLYSDNCVMHLYAPKAGATSTNIAIMNEFTVANTSPPKQTGAMYDATCYHPGEFFAINDNAAPLVANRYKKVGELVCPAGVAVGNSQLMPGAIDLEMSLQNGGFYKNVTIIRSGDTYVVNTDSYAGSSAMKLYIDTTPHLITINGVSYVRNFIYAYVASDVTDLRWMRVTPHSKFVSFYAFTFPTNFTSGSNQNIFSSVDTSALVEIN